MIETEGRDEDTPQQRLEDEALGAETEDPQAETGADTAREAERESEEDAAGA